MEASSRDRHTLRFMNPHYSQVWGETVGTAAPSRVGGTADDSSGEASRSSVYAT